MQVYLEMASVQRIEQKCTPVDVRLRSAEWFLQTAQESLIHCACAQNGKEMHTGKSQAQTGRMALQTP